jgi:2-hydroxychromene-2-carboxylate isomerase
MRLLASVPEPRELARRLFRAYWVEGRDVADREVLRSIHPDLSAIDRPETKERLHALVREAADQGVFGVPTFGIGAERIWGVDRLAFVRRALGLPEDRSAPNYDPRPAEVEWFHDFASPFSYLSSVGVGEIPGVVPRPILLGALFRQIGTPDVPLHTYPAVKQAWVHRDLAAWAERSGVPLRFPSRFPVRTVLPLRAAIVEPGATSAIYRAVWAEDRDVADPVVLAEVLDRAGFDGAAVVGAADGAREALRANTERAASLGVFGVPTFLVDGEPFFGQDRMDHVVHAARGWRV